MKTTYDKEIDAMYVYLKKAKIHKTVPITDDIIVDLDNSGGLIGIEILSASTHVPQELIASSIQLPETSITVEV